MARQTVGSGFGFDPIAEPDDGPDADYELPSSFRAALEAKFGKDEDEGDGVESDDSTEPDSQDVEGSGSSPLPGSSTENEEEEEDEGDGSEPLFVLDTGEGEEGSEDPDPVNASDTATPAQLAQDDLDLNELFTAWNGGAKPTRDQMVSMLQFVQQAATLPPDQQDAINAVLSGQGLPAATNAAPSATAQSAQNPAPSAGFINELPEDVRELLSPLTGHVSQLEQRLAAYEAQTQQTQVAQQQQVFEQGVRAASEEFVKDYSGILSTADLVLLETSAMTSGQFPQFLAFNNNDPRAAYKALLEAAALSNPDLKAKIVAAEVAKNAAQTQQDQTRVRKASAVAAGGSTKPTNKTTRKTPETKAEREAWAADLLRAKLDF